MKNTQVALAVVLVTLASSAAAQSNVNVYGVVDTAIGREYDSEAGTNMLSSYTGTTLLGFRGSEDLGNGLKANFQLEAAGMESDTGAWGGGFGRQSWVGLSGGFGDVMVGRTTTPQNRIMGTFDLNGTAASSALGVLGVAANGAFQGSRQSNQIQYATPTMSGFQARIAYGFSETVSGTSGDKKDFLQLAASYKAGGLTLGAAFQPKSYSRQDAAGDANFRNGYSLGAKYNFGVAEASVIYIRDEDRRTGDAVGVGVAAPLGAFQVGAQFARLINVKNADGTKSAKEGANAYELFANYSLSKRTALYAAYGSINAKAERALALPRDNTFALGVTHKF